MQTMQLPKKYMHDKPVLALVSVNVFLTLVCIVFILLRFGASSGANGYFIQYRQNHFGVSGFKTGGLSNILSFAIFAIVTLIINVLLSIRMYPIRRELSLTILSLGVLLVGLAIIISNALLALL